MLKIDQKEIDNLEKIGSGKFGTIYKKDDKTAYKIYHTNVVSKDEIIRNPALNTPYSHYRTLIERSKSLKLSGGVYDVIYINSFFKGVSIPYYEGVEISKIIDSPLEFKTELAKKIIKCAKELTGKLIYPTDYKMNNIIFTNNDVKIIDLDDTRTHVSRVPNGIFRSISIDALAYTIEMFFQEHHHLFVDKQVANKLGREENFHAITYQKLESYIKRKEILKTIVFSNNIEELKSIKDLILRNDFKIVYLIDSKKLETQEYLNIINTLHKYGLTLFDFVSREKLNNYHYLENIEEEFMLSNQELKKIYKKN